MHTIFLIRTFHNRNKNLYITTTSIKIYIKDVWYFKRSFWMLLCIVTSWYIIIKIFCILGGYTGVNFNLPPEVSSGVQTGPERDCIDQMQDLELIEMERKFREMGFVLDEAESSDRYTWYICIRDVKRWYLYNSCILTSLYSLYRSLNFSGESDILSSFEKLDLDEISQQEYQDSQAWKTEC